MPRDVIVGIRPEDFEDAALVEGAKREQGATITVKPDVLESLGSEVLAYFPVPKPQRRAGGRAATGRRRRSAAATRPAPRARSWPGSTRPPGRRRAPPFDLWFDTHKLHLFDAETGKALGR